MIQKTAAPLATRAAMLLHKHAGNMNAAADALLASLDAEERAEVLREGAMAVLGKARLHSNRTILAGVGGQCAAAPQNDRAPAPAIPTPGIDRGLAGLHRAGAAAVARVQRTLLDYRLSDGERQIRLADADAKALAWAIDQRRQRAATENKCADWLDAIRKRLRGDETVGKRCTPTLLRQLAQKAGYAPED